MKDYCGVGMHCIPRWRGFAKQERAVMHRAQGMNTGTAKTVGLGAKPASPVAKPCAQGDQQMAGRG